MSLRFPASLAAIVLLSASTGAFAAEELKVDPGHSTILFRVKHFNATHVYGRFNEFSGTVTYDEKDPAACAVDLTVQAESVDTNSGGRDKHLKSPDFLNAKEFPTLSFKSKTVKAAGPAKFEVTGDFTLHGVTKPLTLTVEHTGKGKGRGGDVYGFEATFDFKRSDFGMTFMLDGLSDEIRVTVALECGKAGRGR